ncbi:MAG TPA: NAD-dependent epimerase/dehydratase family protein, partial [Nannocystis exedens]|nr:NAD-dependent epimerase/dehydratase family protein [Nannocystis exedens]
RLPVTTGAPYVRSKVRAEQIVREFAAADLDAVIVHPTVVVGPNEIHHVGAVQSLFHRYLEGKLPAVFAGGFDAVAAADVAAGAIAAADRGRRGESYILGGGWHTLRELLGHMQPHCGAPLPRFALPLGLARAGLGMVGAIARISRSQPAFTREDLRQLAGNQRIICAKAETELGYSANSLPAAIERIYGEWRAQRDG